MAKTYYSPSFQMLGQTSSITSSNLPAAPSDKTNTQTATLPAGCGPAEGAVFITVDVVPPAGASGNTTVVVYAWNVIAQAWSQVSSNTVAVGSPATLAQRLTITNWSAPYVAISFTLATNGGGGVGTSFYVGLGIQPT